MTDLGLQTEKTILRVLTEAEREGAHVYALLQRARESIKDEYARAYASTLIRGVTERYLTLDYAIDLFALKKTRNMKPQIRNILRMGAYQVLFMEKVPDAAAVDTCVRLARETGFQMLSGFVNAVLRQMVREKDKIEYPTNSIRYSVPEWICVMLENAYGKTETERMLRWFNEPSGMTLRFDERLTAEEAARYREAIGRANGRIRVTEHRLLPYAYAVTQASDPRALPGYAEGAFALQDAGAMICAEACGVKGGDLVVDVCAAPGGKALHLENRLEACGEGGFVYAFDVSEAKCARIRENASRLRASRIRIDVQDARTAREDLAGMADVVLCDVPCSGIGVLGRKADIRYRLTPDDILALSALQREIVTAAAGYLKDGGTLVYATCTLTHAENGNNVRYITESLGLKPSSLKPFMPKALQGETTLQDGSLTLLPGKYGTDGFFIARFTK
ncbi:MAG: 16S rRNA (cytosine(967)-C(5))-methyltransferase RsmB [Lachnospiraceae bacterium]|nr:16S rRNA (cytosine(967)-C(5))-methyltransferase RsmB [Lachnospiraceae bacterium]